MNAYVLTSLMNDCLEFESCGFLLLLLWSYIMTDVKNYTSTENFSHDCEFIVYPDCDFIFDECEGVFYFDCDSIDYNLVVDHHCDFVDDLLYLTTTSTTTITAASMPFHQSFNVYNKGSLDDFDCCFNDYNNNSFNDFVYGFKSSIFLFLSFLML